MYLGLYPYIMQYISKHIVMASLNMQISNNNEVPGICFKQNSEKEFPCKIEHK